MEGNMKRLAIATFEKLPDATDGDRLLLETLPSTIRATALPWSDPNANWAEFDAVVLRSTWDYHLRREEFGAWLDQLKALGVPTWNSPDTVRWNSDKVYLQGLEARGHKIVPTAWAKPGESVHLFDLIQAHGWSEVVVKPSVSASAYETWRIHGTPSATDEARFQTLLTEQTVLIQPFLPEVVSPGEWSILFMGGKFSHAVIKRPRDGDFRVQKEYGGKTEAQDPPEALLKAAERLVHDLPELPLYARVDGIEREGEFLLIELELIEPDLFLEFAPGAAGALASALLERMGEVSQGG